MFIDATAQACKQNLQTSLKITNTLTQDDRSPASSLLCKMNELLKTIVDSNFNKTSSLPSVGRLYETIGAVWGSAISETEQNLALIYFARSLAVVLEEAVRRLGGEEQIDKSPSVQVHLHAATEAVAVKPVQISHLRGEPIVDKSPHMVVPAVAVKPVQNAAMTAARTIHAALPVEYLRRGPAGRSAEELDYSPDAIAGRVIINNIAFTVKRRQLVNLLKPIDPSFELRFPRQSNGNSHGLAYAKFKNNEKASEAIRKLNGSMLNGKPVKMKRAEFWYKNPAVSTFSARYAAKTHSVGRDTGDDLAISRDTVITDTVDEQANSSASWDSDNVDFVD